MFFFSVIFRQCQKSLLSVEFQEEYNFRLIVLIHTSTKYLKLNIAGGNVKIRSGALVKSRDAPGSHNK